MFTGGFLSFLVRCSQLLALLLYLPRDGSWDSGEWYRSRALAENMFTRYLFLYYFLRTQQSKFLLLCRCHDAKLSSGLTGPYLRLPHRKGAIIGSDLIPLHAYRSHQVYIVWSEGNQTPRFKTPAYQLCSFVLLGYVAVLAAMVKGQVSMIRTDGVCIIGLKNYACVPSR